MNLTLARKYDELERELRKSFQKLTDVLVKILDRCMYAEMKEEKQEEGSG